MSKAVMISIRPKWCEKILSGEKTIEVRKNCPKLETPFKCYIYCTKDAKMQWWTGSRYSYADDHSHNAFDKCGNGKVIGEFVCDRIFPIDLLDNGSIRNWNYAHMDQACLSYEDLAAYIGGVGKRGFGWHISDLVIYDEPKELEEFSPVCDYKNEDGSCPSRKIACYYQNYDYNPDGSINIVECGRTLERPPQSWCYVENMEG